MSPRVAIPLLVAALAAAGTGLATARATQAGRPPRVAAVHAAHALLSDVQLPDRAVPIGHRPRGPRYTELSIPPSRSLYADQIELTRVWRVPGTPRALIAAVERRLPADGRRLSSGGSNDGHGSDGAGPYSTADAVYTFPARTGVLPQLLTLDAGQGARRISYLVARVEVAYAAPRPAGERIGDRARQVTVTMAAPDQAPSVQARLEGRPAAQLARAVDSLPRAGRTGIIGCPAQPSAVPVDTLAFAAGDRVLATVQAPADASRSPSPCFQARLTVGGHHLSLLDGGRLLSLAGHLLGVRLTQRASGAVAVGTS